MARQSKVIPIVQKIISEYSDMRLTIRQIFYRLASMEIITNTRSSYNTLDKALVRARQRGLIPFDAIEDRHRSFLGGQTPFPNHTPEDVFQDALGDYENAEEIFEDSYRNYNLPYWFNQPKYVEVWLEKDALSGVFQNITNKYHVCLAPSKGYASWSYLYEAAGRLGYMAKGEKELMILYFGDYDMRGLDIQQKLYEGLYSFGLNVDVQRVALTKEQISEYNLPPQPSKKLDTMARGWIAEHGDVSWELDALEPKTLMKVITEAIENNIDKTILDARSKTIEASRQQIKTKIKEYLD